MKSRPVLITTMAVLSAAALSITGCSGGSSTNNSSKSSKITFVPGVVGDEFYITMGCGIQAKAKELGATYLQQGPQKSDPAEQRTIIDSVVAAKPDAMLVAPADVTAMEAPLKAASSSGIKVGLVDTTVTNPSFAVTEVASDNVGGGAAAFKALEDQIPNGGKLLIISQKPGISTLDLRTQGFVDAAKANSKFEVLPVQYNDNDVTKAAQIVTATLQQYPDLAGIFSTNIFAAEGSSTGIRQAGKTGQVKVVGFDAGPKQVEQLRAGTVQALIAQQPALIGSKGVEQIMNALNNRAVDKKIQTSFKTLTSANIDTDGKEYIYKSSC